MSGPASPKARRPHRKCLAGEVVWRDERECAETSVPLRIAASTIITVNRFSVLPQSIRGSKSIAGGKASICRPPWFRLLPNALDEYADGFLAWHRAEQEC